MGPSFTANSKSGGQGEFLAEPGRTLSAVKAGLLDVEEQQVHAKVVPVDVEMDLPADEGKAGPEFTKGFRDPAG
jgi:hypothetical protein